MPNKQEKQNERDKKLLELVEKVDLLSKQIDLLLEAAGLNYNANTGGR